VGWWGECDLRGGNPTGAAGGFEHLWRKTIEIGRSRGDLGGKDLHQGVSRRGKDPVSLEESTAGWGVGHLGGGGDGPGAKIQLNLGGGGG